MPAVRPTRCRLSQGPQGALLGRCLKVPSDLEAKVGYHIDTKDPPRQSPSLAICTSRPLLSTAQLGLELPLGNATYPANAKEGTHFIAHRAALAMPVLPGQVQLGDAAYDVSANYQWIGDRGGIAVFAYNRRNEDLSPETLVERGYDHNDTPYAPAAVFVAPMGTTTKPTLGNMSVAGPVRPRSSSHALTPLACWAIATA